MFLEPEKQAHRPTATADATPARPGVIELTRLTKQIDDREVLAGVDARIDQGEFVALLGSNGAGKTTLLKILALLSSPSGGSLSLFGSAAHRRQHELRRRIGMIGHQSMLYGELSAHENLLFFGKLYGLTNPEARSALLLERLGLRERSHDPVKHFSRGMLQRAAIARALLHDPDLILADEPFTGLDAASTLTLETLFNDLHRLGKTTVLVHHDLAHATRLAKRAIVLHRGRIALDRSTDRLSVEQIIAEVTR